MIFKRSKLTRSLLVLAASMTVTQSLSWASEPLPPELQGTWTTGFQTRIATTLGVGAFFNIGLRVEGDIIQQLVRVSPIVFSRLVKGEDSAVHMKVTSWKREPLEPVGKKGIVPDQLFSIEAVPVDVQHVILSPQDAVRANAIKACGLDAWIPGAPRSIFGTRCVKGDRSGTWLLMIAMQDGRVIVPMEDIDDLAGDPNGDDSQDEVGEESDLGIEHDFGLPADPEFDRKEQLDSMSFDLPLRRSL